MPQLVYHVTPASNLTAIYAQGLVPQIGPRSRLARESRPAVYCFPTQEAMETALSNWLGEQFDLDEELVVLQIDTDLIDGPLLCSTIKGSYEVMFEQAIPAHAIVAEISEAALA